MTNYTDEHVKSKQRVVDALADYRALGTASALETLKSAIEAWQKNAEAWGALTVKKARKV